MAEYQRSNEESLWIERATQGDDDAFAQIVESYQIPVYNLCYRMLGNREEADRIALLYRPLEAQEAEVGLTG